MKTSGIFKRLQISAAVIAMASGSLLPAASFAATDGTLGSTSTGTVDISVTKPAQARISAMTDMTVASWVIGDGAVAINTDACVYSTGAVGSTAGNYTIKATGSHDGAGGVGTAFFLWDTVVSAAASHNIPYAVHWHAGGTGTGGTALTANSTSGNFTSASTTADDCGGVNNVTVNVDITNADMSAAAAGTFTDTLTLLITPN